MAAVASPASRSFEEIGSEQLVQISERIDVVIEDRVAPAPWDAAAQPVSLIPIETVPRVELGKVLSPTQVRTFLNCSARWWFKYALFEPETKNSALALGSAVHRALEANFREKVTTKEDLDTLGVVALFRDAWQEQVAQAEFREDEDPAALGKVGEQLVTKYMDEAAPWIQPAAVELDVTGEISGVRVRGKVDLLDEDGRVVDVKTAARKPSGIAPDYAFQLATYRQITPGASGEARLDTLVR
jgi:CRISPR/Cas system-associated exonuclease Cas4 (RecB family)